MSSERSRKVGRPAGGRARLTRAGILATALALVDEHGLEALTMRRLATAVDADPMSIYHHLPNKAAIVSGLVREVFAEMRLPDLPDAPWPDRVRSWARAYRELALAHPNLVLQIVTDAAAVTEASALVDAPLHAALESAGLPAETAAHAGNLLVDYVNGYALGQATSRSAGPTGPSAGFETGLDIVIAGVTALATRS